MQEVATFGAEAGGAIRHDALSLGGANFTAKVGLAGFAEFAVAAFGCTGTKRMKVSLEHRMGEGEEGSRILLERDNIIAYFHRRNSLAH